MSFAVCACSSGGHFNKQTASWLARKLRGKSEHRASKMQLFKYFLTERIALRAQLGCFRLGFVELKVSVCSRRARGSMFNSAQNWLDLAKCG